MSRGIIAPYPNKDRKFTPIGLCLVCGEEIIFEKMTDNKRAIVWHGCKSAEIGIPRYNDAAIADKTVVILQGFLKKFSEKCHSGNMYGALMRYIDPDPVSYYSRDTMTYVRGKMKVSDKSLDVFHMFLENIISSHDFLLWLKRVIRGDEQAPDKDAESFEVMLIAMLDRDWLSMETYLEDLA